MPNTLADLALCVWPLFVLTIFLSTRPSQAVIYSYLLAWMFLPVHSISIPGFIDVSKGNVTAIGVVLSTLVVRHDLLRTLKPCWLDWPVVIFCLVPSASLFANGYSTYDVTAKALAMFLAWGVPYLCGRLYLRDLDAFRDLAIGLIVAGLIYVPFCLVELRMSPQLNQWVYGYQQHSFVQTIRFGGYRPMVFMSHGLALGLFMSISSLCCVSAYLSRSWSWLHTAQGKIAMGLLLVTTLMCKSTGAIVLLIAVIFVLLLGRRFTWRAPCLGLLLVPVVYCFLRIMDFWSGASLVDFVSQFSPDRAGSLGYRLAMEERLMAKAWAQPVLGWGSYGESLLYDRSGRSTVVTDSAWIIQFGSHGFAGLLSFLACLLGPPLVLLWKWPMTIWRHPAASTVFAMILCAAMFALDSLMNSQSKPVLILSLGALASIATEKS